MTRESLAELFSHIPAEEKNVPELLRYAPCYRGFAKPTKGVSRQPSPEHPQRGQEKQPRESPTVSTGPLPIATGSPPPTSGMDWVKQIEEEEVAKAKAAKAARAASRAKKGKPAQEVSGKPAPSVSKKQPAASAKQASAPPAPSFIQVPSGSNKQAPKRAEFSPLEDQTLPKRPRRASPGAEPSFPAAPNMGPLGDPRVPGPPRRWNPDIVLPDGSFIESDASMVGAPEIVRSLVTPILLPADMTRHVTFNDFQRGSTSLIYHCARVCPPPCLFFVLYVSCYIKFHSFLP